MVLSQESEQEHNKALHQAKTNSAHHLCYSRYRSILAQASV